MKRLKGRVGFPYIMFFGIWFINVLHRTETVKYFFKSAINFVGLIFRLYFNIFDMQFEIQVYTNDHTLNNYASKLYIRS